MDAARAGRPPGGDGAHIAHWAETGLVQNAKGVGEQAPDIVLPDAHGKSFEVASLLVKGPVIVSFYRGGWCPYCNLELKAYQGVLPRGRRISSGDRQDLATAEGRTA